MPCPSLLLCEHGLFSPGTNSATWRWAVPSDRHCGPHNSYEAVEWCFRSQIIYFFHKKHFESFPSLCQNLSCLLCARKFQRKPISKRSNLLMLCSWGIVGALRYIIFLIYSSQFGCISTTVVLNEAVDFIGNRVVSLLKQMINRRQSQTSAQTE